MFDNRYVAILADTQESEKIYEVLSNGLNNTIEGSVDGGKEKVKPKQNIDNAVHFIVLDNIEWCWLATLSIYFEEFARLSKDQRSKLGTSVSDEPTGNVAKISGISLISYSNNHSHETRSDKEKRKAETVEICLGLIRAATEYCNKRGLKHGLLFTPESVTLAFRQSALKMRKVGQADKGNQDVCSALYIKLDEVVSKSVRNSDQVLEMFRKRGTYFTYSKLASVFSDLPG